MTLEEAKEKLAKYGQEHVLKYYDELTDAEKQELLTQIDETDFAVLENCKNLGKSGCIIFDYIIRKKKTQRYCMVKKLSETCRHTIGKML